MTGSTGFVGYHLTKRLLKDGYEMHLLVRQGSNTEQLKALSGNFTIYEHDGTTAGMLKILQMANPDTVFHLASMTLSDHQPEDVEPLVRSNILLGTQLLEASVRSGVKCFINTGTFWQHYKDEEYNPVCLYAATKQAFNDILRFYIEAYPLSSLTLILFDTYGPNDRRNKLFNLLRQAHLKGELLKMSSGGQLMDLVYIDDTVDAFLAAEELLSKDKTISGKSFAVSSGRHIFLKDVVAMYEVLSGATILIEWGGKPYRAREVIVPWNGKVLPNWKARVSLEQGIKAILSEGKD